MGKRKQKKPESDELFIFRSESRSGRQRVQKIRAPSFELAKEKAILQFSNIFYFKPKPMDLLTALSRAAKASKDAKKTYYIILDGEDGECSIGTAPLRGATHKFVAGKEDKSFFANHAKAAQEEYEKPKAKSLPAQSEKAKKLIGQKTAKESAEEDSKNSKNKKDKSMDKLVAKKSAKKVAKKSAKPAKKNSGDWGKKVTMTNKEMTAKIKKGYVYRNSTGVNKTKYIPERPNQDLVNEDYFESKPE
ncbi:MAG TPA: hypothetical protein VKC54_01930 [Patescibacteria group bacterium]|nr:hypothetical protein [Patescibacteria group bacterium]